MVRRFRSLSNFIGCIFHEDWDLDGPTVEAVVQRYLQEASSDEQELVRQEFTVALTSLSDNQLDELVHESTCCYLFEADGLNARQWLERLHALMRA